MARENALLWAFNRGIISKKGLSRVDLKRTALSAEIQTNWMPGSLGSMMLRPGLPYIGSTASDAAAVHLPFIFSTDDTAIIELTNSAMRVRVDESIISRVATSTAITNGTFDSNITGWTDADEAGATSQWVTGGYMGLTGTNFAAAVRTQQVTVAVADQNKEHAIRITIERGLVRFKLGSTSGGEQYISEKSLKPGVYSFAFTPTTDIHITLSSLTKYQSLVDSIVIESAGSMTLPSPWVEADLPNIRFDQSGDVIFISCRGQQQRRIERYGVRSWGIAYYLPEDGPFRVDNISTTTITPSALDGDVTLTASTNFFQSSHVGALIRIRSIGQVVGATFTAANQYSDPIRVSGVGNQRQFSISRDGTWVATLTLQRSIGEPGSWTDVTGYTTSATTDQYSDGLDNQIVYYRIGIKTGNYTSGTATVSLSYASGGLTGIARIHSYSSATSVSAHVLTAFGGTGASSDWSEGEWSGYRGWPSAVALYEGRLWWAGKDKVWGSVSDAFDSFDDEIEGNSAPISRSIGRGPVDNINWMLPLQRLILGAGGAEWSARSSTFDEPLTPTNFNLKDPSTQGSAPITGVKIDIRGVFVQKAGKRLFQLEYDSGINDYISQDLTLFAPEVTAAGIKKVAVQRQPDTRIHCVLDDGTVAILLYNPLEELKCWIAFETDGLVEDVVVLPGDEEDKVYYLVNRTINGSTKRYLERWALESECVGGTLNLQADSLVTYSGAATTTITAAHLANKSVVVWGDGKDLGTITLNGSGIGTLSTPVTSYCVGLGYTARFKSAKLAYAAQAGTGLTQQKRIPYLGLIMLNTHAQGLRYGGDFDHLDDLPLVKDGVVLNEDEIHDYYDMEATEFNDTWNTDSRLCLEAAAPRPATVSAAVISVITNEKL